MALSVHIDTSIGCTICDRKLITIKPDQDALILARDITAVFGRHMERAHPEITGKPTARSESYHRKKLARERTKDQ